MRYGRLLPLAAAILLLAAGAARAQGEDACDSGSAPGVVDAVKVVLIDQKTVEVMWLPPSSAGCISSFTVTGKDVGTGKSLPARGVSDGLRTTYSDLWPGATYEFAVTAGGPGGKGGARPARAAMPPAFLDSAPDAPERLAAVALSDSQAQVTWAAPAGNPKVDAWELSVVPVNATGFPLQGGRNGTFTVSGTSKEFTAKGLQPGSFYVFAVVAKNGRGASPEPSLAFFATPARGAGVPDAPWGLEAQPAGNGMMALRWQAPGNAQPDYYEIGITEVDGSGKRLSDTNTIANANTTALVRDLNPGATYEFSVRAFSVAYNAGQTTRITAWVPSNYQPQPQAPTAAPANLQARIYGGDVEVMWAPLAGADYYAVSLFDAYSGRSLGLRYETADNVLTFGGLPVGQAVTVVVQGVGGGGYHSPAASTVVEIAPPSGGYYYSSSYSPYYGYNAYLPYWYARHYPTGYYNAWYRGRLVLTSAIIGAALSPFNNFYGPNWWSHRASVINPLRPLSPYRPLRSWSGAGGWNLGNAAFRPRPGGVGGVGGVGGRLPGQRPVPINRPPVLSNIVRPSNRPFPSRPPTVPSFPGFPRPGGNNWPNPGTPGRPGGNNWPTPGTPGRPGGNNWPTPGRPGGGVPPVVNPLPNIPNRPNNPSIPNRPGGGGGGGGGWGPRPGGGGGGGGGWGPRPGGGGGGPYSPGRPRPGRGFGDGAPSTPAPVATPSVPSVPGFQPRPSGGGERLELGGVSGGGGGGFGGNRGGFGGGGNPGGWGGNNGGGFGGNRGGGGGFGGGGGGGGGFGGNRGGGFGGFGRRRLHF